MKNYMNHKVVDTKKKEMCHPRKLTLTIHQSFYKNFEIANSADARILVVYTLVPNNQH